QPTQSHRLPHIREFELTEDFRDGGSYTFRLAEASTAAVVSSARCLGFRSGCSTISPTVAVWKVHASRYFAVGVSAT
ncbi:MAG TPA: hypothetical protein VKP30_17670, partial [Polyangiaceae bacterium]|nr:hypothetical protein [Polyangiaceae bacterium]